MKLRIVCPHYYPIDKGGMNPITFNQIMNLKKSIDNKEGRIIKQIELIFPEGMYVDRARNNGINLGESYAIRQYPPKCDYILFWDSDNFVNSSPLLFIEQMIMIMIYNNICVFSGAYPFRKESLVAKPHLKDKLVAGYWLRDNAPLMDRHVDINEISINNISINTISIDWCGAGFLLCNSEIFDSLEFPWFHDVIVESRGMRYIVKEDAVFCWHCKQKGIEIWLYCKEILGHDREY